MVVPNGCPACERLISLSPIPLHTYSHVSPDMQEKAVSAMEDAFS
jgi:hypothetical protein